VLWTRGGPSGSGQTPRTPRPRPSPSHITRSLRGRPPSPPFRNVDARPAAVRPPPSILWSVYHSLSIVQVGAAPPPGAMALQRAVYRPRDGRAHRAPPSHRRAPGGLPARGGRGRRRRGPAAVRRARVPGVPAVRRLRTQRGAVSVRGLRARAPGTVLVQRPGVVSQLRGPADDGAGRPSGGRCSYCCARRKAGCRWCARAFCRHVDPVPIATGLKRDDVLLFAEIPTWHSRCNAPLRQGNDGAGGEQSMPRRIVDAKPEDGRAAPGNSLPADVEVRGPT
jgi:hypothetical protein